MAQKAKCEKCGTEFLIVTKEIEFYKEKDFPLPKLCPTHRLERRLALRNKKELLGYNCDNCGKDIVIAFDPPEDQKVFCKECYQTYMQENDCILGYSEGAKKEQGIQTKTTAETTPPESQASTSAANTVKDPIDW